MWATVSFLWHTFITNEHANMKTCTEASQGSHFQFHQRNSRKVVFCKGTMYLIQ